jgi:hypothetical protein
MTHDDRVPIDDLLAAHQRLHDFLGGRHVYFRVEPGGDAVPVEHCGEDLGGRVASTSTECRAGTLDL